MDLAHGQGEIVFVTLEKWARDRYGESAPTVGTLRRWCRDGKIFPLPQKHGRSYFLEPNARYVGDYNNTSFIGGIHESAQAQ